MQEVQISICDLDVSCKQLQQLLEKAAVRNLHISFVLITLSWEVNMPQG